jgi:hypothetical protein
MDERSVAPIRASNAWPILLSDSAKWICPTASPGPAPQADLHVGQPDSAQGPRKSRRLTLEVGPVSQLYDVL